jgi:hypothetical protein
MESIVLNFNLTKKQQLSFAPGDISLLCFLLLLT